MQKITSFLWFDNQAEDAVNFYCSVFKNSKAGKIARYDEAGSKAAGRPAGSVMTASFELEGHEFVALNGGPAFKFNPSISFIVNCKTANEAEDSWNKLIEGGTTLMALDKYPFSEKYGWLQDKYGLSWQLIVAMGEIKQNIIPCMMFVGEVAGKAEEAINLYTSLFGNSKVGNIFRYGPGQQPDKEGTVMFADFTLHDQWFAAMDSAREHKFAFNEAISFVVNCDTQDEVDYYWNELTGNGGEESQCGWLKDKFGVSWQITPTVLIKYINDSNAKKAKSVMQAMLQMRKIEIAPLKEAYANA
jgi:predicted 3-demethylubiquinone-9 3-methyltransferase (glyoxalase superfamily)